ncbi:PBP1 and LysM peptidoglycan-binding domain-containing protein [Gaetbulibacter saemankumensis]|uniref:PBP1 and LysM peptidoglycan-binding domain-containing protein n=1 Tax=Gaetbulibacter saemankumensis TaxID=311208 RepID=UPI0004035EFE|nr:LysM peptidoglycan-binding domain-containing protein [Gaetbulibacter saemankumensis]
MIKFFSVLSFILLFSLNTLQAQNFSTHQVKKGETIESIAKKYFVTKSQLYKLNPDAKRNLKPHTILIIPISEAKPPKVTVTRELQSFREHKVNRRETLYSLSKEYNVTTEELKKYNKFLYANTLRKGDVLQIPVFKTVETIVEVPETKLYTVQPKEGKWRIAYKYGLTVNELEELNPEMGDTLQVGQEIKVPNIEKIEEKQLDSKYSYYRVLPKEGFYRLKLKLGLEQEVLENLNPELKDSGLKEGMILKIPYTQSGLGSLSVDPEKINLASKITDFNTKHIAVMLPFRVNRVNFDSISGTKQSIKKDPYLNASLDFYSGVLVAIDSLKKIGVSLKVDVYDTQHQVSEVIKIMNDNNFEDVDAVIGPLTATTFDKVATSLKEYNVPVFSPIGTDLKLHDNVFQTKPSDDLLKTKILNYIKTDTITRNIVIISDSKNQSRANDIKREFNYAKLVHSRKDKEGREANYVMVDDIREVLVPGENLVFLETQNAGFASNVTSILASLIQKEDEEKELEEIKIELATTHFNSAFEGDDISNEHLSRLKFKFATGAKSYNDSENNSFIKTYESIYHITPDKSAVKGFDLTMDVVLRLVTSEDLYMSVNQSPLTEYVENKFGYKKELFGGYYNSSVYLVQYNDLRIEEIKL